MKTIMLRFLFLCFMGAVLMFVACSPDGPTGLGSTTTPLVEFATANVPSEQMPFILADTVTPPANPMAPEDLSAYPTYSGALQLYPANSFSDINGQYFCGIELENRIEVIVPDNQSRSYSALYLIDRDSKEPIRFDHPLLQSCVVGDTILVTGTPVNISNGMALGISMYFVQPLHP